jgi:hypothetical protein
MRFVHSLAYRQPPDVEMDLHWRPVHEPVSVEGFWDDAVAFEVGSEPTLALDPADELLVACKHAVYGGCVPGRWVLDAAFLIRTAGDELDWMKLAERAEALRLTAGARHALEVLAADFHVPVPGAVIGRLARARAPLYERAAHRMHVRPPRRGATLVEQWAYYRRRRLVQPESDSFPRYVRELRGAHSWRDLVRRHRRLRRALT